MLAFGMSTRRQTSINAVYETDLSSFLEAAGLAQGLGDAKLLCQVCGDPIDVATLYGFVAIAPDTVRPICTRPQCISAAYDLARSDSFNEGGSRRR